VYEANQGWKEVENVEIKIDRRQIQRIRYVVPLAIGTEKPKSPYFEAMFNDHSRTTVPDDYVQSVFAKDYVDSVVQQGLAQSKKFFFLPPGAPRTVTGAMAEDTTMPRLRYLQETKNTCLFSSFASALYYLGLKESAEYMAAQRDKYASDAKDGFDNWKVIGEVFRKTCPWLRPRHLHCKYFNVLTDISEYPTVLNLESTDGNMEHAVTVVGKFIFDSNCMRALPLTMESLHYCCSTDNKAGHFRQVKRGTRFEENANNKNPKLRKLIKNMNN
jgi:hypothetical protein